MTLKDAKIELRHYRMVIRKVDGEFRVNFANGREETAYYATSIHDAIETAKTMRRAQLAGDRK